MPAHTDAQSFLRAARGGVEQCFAALGAKVRPASAERAASGLREAPPTRHGLVSSWWAGFGEPMLVVIQQAIASRALADGGYAVKIEASASMSLPLDAQVAVAFVATRVLNVRRALAEELGRDLIELRGLVAAGAPSPARDEILADLDARLAADERHARAIEARRDEWMRTFAFWCGLAPEAFPDDFRVALAAPKLPAFDAEPPPRLARAMLMQRPDVGEAYERLSAARADAPDDRSLVEAMRWFGGWIEAPVSDATSVRQTLQGEPADKFMQVAEQAEREVRDSLAELWDSGREAERAAAMLRQRRRDVTEAERRQRRGTGSRAEVLVARQPLLFEGDRLATASGDLALAWMRLDTSTGGRGLPARAHR